MSCVFNACRWNLLVFLAYRVFKSWFALVIIMIATHKACVFRFVAEVCTHNAPGICTDVCCGPIVHVVSNHVLPSIMLGEMVVSVCDELNRIMVITPSAPRRIMYARISFVRRAFALFPCQAAPMNGAPLC